MDDVTSVPFFSLDARFYYKSQNRHLDFTPIIYTVDTDAPEISECAEKSESKITGVRIYPLIMQYSRLLPPLTMFAFIYQDELLFAFCVAVANREKYTRSFRSFNELSPPFHRSRHEDEKKFTRRTRNTRWSEPPYWRVERSIFDVDSSSFCSL